MQTRKFLIVGPSWVGDMVMTHTLFQLLRARHPGAIIDVLAPKGSGAVVERMPEVRNLIPLPIKHGQLALRKRYQIARSLREQQYDQAIIIPNSFKSALIPFWANIPIRTGWRGEMRYGLLNDMRYLDKKALPLMFKRFTALGLPKNTELPNPLPLPILTTSTQSCATTQLVSKGTRPILALCPGAEYGPAKQWPAEHVATVGRTLVAKGWDIWLFGGPNDIAITQQIANNIGDHCYNLGGKTSLTEAIDLLSLVDAVLTNDSGLMHIAAGLKRPLIVTFGSTSPGVTPPLTQYAKNLSLHLPCSPCLKRTCPLGHLRCLNDLTPQMVLNALDELQRITKQQPPTMLTTPETSDVLTKDDENA